MQNVKRDISLDFMKGMVTILMIAAHIIQFYVLDKHALTVFSNYVNLTTFSAFMFCFGYVCDLVYFSKDTLPQKKILIGAVKCLFAFYISAFAVDLILHKKSFSEIQSILWFSRISTYSEFLLSFFYLYVFILIFGKQIKQIVGNNLFLIAAILLSLSLTRIPYNKITIAQLSPLIGNQKLPCFPILQYFSYFLIGAFIARYQIIFNRKIFFISLLGSMYLLIYTMMNNYLPHRFPPTFRWIVGGYFPVYIYYIFSKKFSHKNKLITEFFSSIGRNTLTCLVVSNLCLFLIKSSCTFNLNKMQISMVFLWYFLLLIIIILSCFIFIKLTELIKKQ